MTTTAPTKEIAQTDAEKIERLKEVLRNEHMKTLQNLLGDEKEAHKFLSAMTYSVKNAPKLLNCTIDTVIPEFMKCAELQLYPSSVSGECYIIPYGNEAVFQLGYQGLVKLMARSGVMIVAAEIVYKKDHWKYEEGLKPVFEHRPDVFAKDRGEAIGVYVIAEINGVRIPHVMGKDKIFEFRDLSAAFKNGKKDSPWLSGKDPEYWMWKKTCLKQLSKYVPKNEALSSAISWDNEESIIARPVQPKTIKAPDLSKMPLLTGEEAAKNVQKVASAASIEVAKTDAEDIQNHGAIDMQTAGEGKEVHTTGTITTPQKTQEQGKLPI